MTAAGAHTRPLAELRSSDAGVFGGKSASLGELLQAGIPVPPGFAISASGFRAFVEEAGLADRIERALAGVAIGDVERTAAVSKAIGEELRSAPMPEALVEEIGSRYRELAGTGEPEPPVAVRSSALGEDSPEATFAGQQETYLWVRGAGVVRDAVRDCWVSLYSPQAISYRARLGGGETAAMGVTVQLMVDAEVSGVMFTCNPVSGDPSMVAINASWGLGLAVVGGELTPDDFLVSKVTREVVKERLSRKKIEYVPDAHGRGTVRVDVPAERQKVACLDPSRLAALVDVARRIERHFGSHQDIEWAFARCGGELFVLQSRPVTAAARPDEPPKHPASAMSLVMETFGAGRRAD